MGILKEAYWFTTDKTILILVLVHVGGRGLLEGEDIER